MKIYDITQELFTCQVYPGDPAPSFERVLRIADGSICNLSKIEMGVHNGTHLDAPWHFLENGRKIDQLELDKCVGKAVVVKIQGDITAEVIESIYAGRADNPAYKRILFKGDGALTITGARQLNCYGVELVGSESQSVGPVEAPAEVHYELLGREVILLEGLVLKEVPVGEQISPAIAVGEYFLSAAPLKLGGADGAPCRAVLIEGFNP